MLYINPMTAHHGGRIETSAEAQKEKVALEELEHMFLWTLMREMRKSVPKDTLLGGGYERELFDDMLNDSLSAQMARSGQVGLAKQLAEQLNAIKIREKAARNVQAQGNKQLEALDTNRIQASLGSADTH